MYLSSPSTEPGYYKPINVTAPTREAVVDELSAAIAGRTYQHHHVWEAPDGSWAGRAWVKS